MKEISEMVAAPRVSGKARRQANPHRAGLRANLPPVLWSRIKSVSRLRVRHIYNLGDGFAGLVELLQEVNFLGNGLPDGSLQHLRQELALRGDVRIAIKAFDLGGIVKGQFTLFVATGFAVVKALARMHRRRRKLVTVSKPVARSYSAAFSFLNLRGCLIPS